MPYRLLDEACWATQGCAPLLRSAIAFSARRALAAGIRRSTCSAAEAATLRAATISPPPTRRAASTARLTRLLLAVICFACPVGLGHCRCWFIQFAKHPRSIQQARRVGCRASTRLGGSLCRRNSMGSAPPSGLELRRAAAVVLPEAFKVLPVGPGPRFDSDRVNPCFKPRAPAHGRRLCIPYFYILGQFHSGAFDLYERISHHPSVAHRPPAASRFNGEVHAWEKMMWRGCDYGSCPRHRGAGAEPIPLPAALASDRGAVFGEVMGSGLSFTWGSTHSLMHSTYTANMTACWQAGFRGPRQQVCYGRAMAAQSEWERSIGAGNPNF